MHPFVIAGGGIAGLRAALELAEQASVIVLAKSGLEDSATRQAQGGIAVAWGDDDTLELHEQDTLAAGAGLCEPEAVRVLVSEGPARVRELVAWGAQFDRQPQTHSLARGREAAHSRARILHAQGDATGREIARVLEARARAHANIRILAPAGLTRIWLGPRPQELGCMGVIWRDAAGREHAQPARAVLLATGGMGQLFAATTNPAMATGDGPMMAHAAGAELADLEFVQFHPTVLALPGAPAYLLSEALRGEGARLVNRAGERFLAGVPGGELAARDVVARALAQELARSGEAAVYLDLTHLSRTFLEGRFPGIYAACQGWGLALERDRIPVRPAAHYAMGGIRTDREGQSSLAGLYAAGEAACSGVHGANRLASNSLLECLVFGYRAARAMARCEPIPIPAASPDSPLAPPGRHETAEWPVEQIQAQLAQLRARMAQAAGVLRDGDLMRQTLAWIQSQPRYVSASGAAGREWNSLRPLAELLLRAGLHRRESRGAHWRADYPSLDAKLNQRHTVIASDGEIQFEGFQPLLSASA